MQTVNLTLKCALLPLIHLQKLSCRMARTNPTPAVRVPLTQPERTTVDWYPQTISELPYRMTLNQPAVLTRLPLSQPKRCLVLWVTWRSVHAELLELTYKLRAPNITLILRISLSGERADCRGLDDPPGKTGFPVSHWDLPKLSLQKQLLDKQNNRR